MSDIVERLRYAATSRPGGICEEAADEIERLRETVKNLRESAKLRVHYHAAELADVTAERDEARAQVAALEADMVMVPRDLLRRLIAEALTFDPNLQDKGAITQAKQLAAAAELARAGAQKGE